MINVPAAMPRHWWRSGSRCSWIDWKPLVMPLSWFCSVVDAHVSADQVVVPADPHADALYVSGAAPWTRAPAYRFDAWSIVADDAAACR